MKNKFYSCLEIALCTFFLMLSSIIMYIVFFREGFFEISLQNIISLLFLIVGPVLVIIVMAIYGLPRFEVTEKGITKRLFGIKLKHFNWEQITCVRVHSNGAFGKWIFLSKSDITKYSLGRCRLRRDNIFFYSSSKKIEIVKTFAPEIIIDELNIQLDKN